MINLTESAVKQIISLTSQEKDPSVRVRMYVQGGGCSGFQYGFEFTNEQAEDDWVIPAGDTSLLVDPISMQYLQETEVDYKEDLSGARFVINNPMAVTTCGCGSSFSPY